MNLSKLIRSLVLETGAPRRGASRGTSKIASEDQGEATYDRGKEVGASNRLQRGATHTAFAAYFGNAIEMGRLESKT